MARDIVRLLVGAVSVWLIACPLAAADEAAKADSIRLQVVNLMEQGTSVRRSLSSHGIDSAMALYERARNLAESHFGKRDTLVASALYGLAMMHIQYANWSYTDSLLHAAIDVWETALGPNHPAVGQGLQGLAWSYYRQRREAEEEPLLERAIPLLRTAPASYRNHLVNALNSMAHLRRNLGRYAEADSLYLQAIQVAESVPSNEFKAAQIRSNLATSYVGQERYAEAEGCENEHAQASDRPLSTVPVGFERWFGTIAYEVDRRQ